MLSIQNLLLLCGVTGDAPPETTAVVELLLERALGFAASYTGLDKSDEALEGVVSAMVAQDYARFGGEGVACRSFSTVRESYRPEYTKPVMDALARVRRLKTVSGNCAARGICAARGRREDA